jgi:hypothetical protein
MKRLCVFYCRPKQWLGKKNIEWIVCKECQRELQRGHKLKVFFRAANAT